ncbi:MAG: CaiB/BaiF CoA transferase family protein [Gammaproteobacteria bacterium]
MTRPAAPLAGITVLDFSTLLPGPMATLLLAEAGADVIKIERPGTGDEMRTFEPKMDGGSINFALLNRGKRSVATDLKDPECRDAVLRLVEGADVLVEQFRPGVMDRLGLGYDRLKVVNPRLVYCAITGYGQTGPRANEAGHDLNYIARTGLLKLAADDNGAPVVPPALIADIAGGTYPAVMNILLALRTRDLTGEGCKLDIAMSDGLFTFMYWAMGAGHAKDRWPIPGGELVTGGSPRYRVYRTADDRFVAAAPLEQRFWDNFCELIELPERLRDDAIDPKATIAAVAERIATRTGDEWERAFEGRDVCACVAASLEDAVNDEHFVQRGLFDATVRLHDTTLPAVPVPIAPAFRGAGSERSYPALNADGKVLGLDSKDGT